MAVIPRVEDEIDPHSYTVSVKFPKACEFPSDAVLIASN